MPVKPLKPCKKRGCPELVTGRFCAQHEPPPAPDTRHESAAKRGYDSKWRKLRLMKLRRDPICQIRHLCRGAIATEVDHIVPIKRAPEKRLDMANLQSACKACHSWKTNAYDGGGWRK